MTSIADRNSLLDGMGILDISNTFNGDNVFTVNADERSDAGIHRGMVNLLRCGIDMRDDLLNK